ncbi:MAG: aspartyl/asparaginyl beta-hydroxylase domain-containing protein [Bacteroidetes bacterium]|nr:aspartyl/asparaginyl beta-hydroxylase domain-containing protein [Bacteroidota bacterium]
MQVIPKWFSFVENGNYKGSEPFFFDITQKPWKAILEDNYLVILKKLELLIQHQNKNIVPYFNQTLASTPAAWSVFPLLFWGSKYADNCLQAKETIKIINQIPGVLSCGFSILKPNTFIKPHDGDSNVMYRCHLTLRSRGTIEEIGMRVGTETITWQNGKTFAFCDAYNHEVWNKTNDERWILIIDVLREEFLDEKVSICKYVNATLWWQLKFQKNYFFKHLPRWSRRWLIAVTAVFMKG